MNSYTDISHQLISYEDSIAREVEALLIPFTLHDELIQRIEEDKQTLKPMSPRTWELFNALLRGEL